MIPSKVVRRQTPNNSPYWRTQLMLWSWLILFLVILSRLFWWQIVQSQTLQAAASDQYQTQVITPASRGKIYSADGYLLAGNQVVYRLFANPQALNRKPEEIAALIGPIIAPEFQEYQLASTAAQKTDFDQSLKTDLITKLSQSQKQWISLKAKISENTTQQLKQLNLAGIATDPYEARYYPEASLSAHVLGFVGKDEKGLDTGYFGIEGAMNKELAGQSRKSILETDAFGLQLFKKNQSDQATSGRDVVLTIRRDIQMMAEEMVEYGVEKYGASAGEIVIADPKTGKILALATTPHYDPLQFFSSPADIYRNPSLASVYEPGSTFKTLTVAAGIDNDVIDENTECEQCEGPRVIGKYTIRTWNDQYHPRITMTQALAKSDNTAMIFIAEKLGKQKFQEYIKNFGIGEKLDIDLQEDTSTPLNDKMSEIDLATNSFGQGIGTTTLQLIRAVGAIANHGLMMKPIIVEKVIDPVSHQTITTPITEQKQVIKPETARTVTKMMVTAASEGEAKWTASRTHIIAGKTGTSQVAAEGKYDESKTIASFIGFAPADDPKFIMIVKLTEPQTSIWAADTAAPLWYKVANRLYLLLNIPPDKQVE